MNPLRGARKNIYLLYSIAFFGNGYFERAIWILYFYHLGYSLLYIGIFQALINGAMFVAEIPTGLIADRFGRKTAMIIGRICIIMYFVGLLLFDNFYLLAIAGVLLGIGFTFISGTDEAMLYDSLKKIGEERTYSRVLGRYNAINIFALALCMGAGGWLQEFSWSTVFISAILFHVIALLITLGLKEIRFGDSPKVKNLRELVSDVRQFLFTKGRVQFFLISFAAFSGVGSVFHIFNQDLFSKAGFSIRNISLLFALESLLSAGCSIYAYRLENRFLPKKVLIGSLLSFGVLYFLISFNRIWLLLIAFFGISSIYELVELVSKNLMNRFFPSEQRATLLSVVNFIDSLVMLMLSPVLGFFADLVGVHLLLSISGIISVVLFLYCIFYFFKAESDMSSVVRTDIYR